MKDIPPEVIEALNRGHRVWVDMWREQMKIPSDWIYRRFTASMNTWKEFEEVIGTDNFIVVSGNVVTNDVHDQRVSYSLFVSPTGIENATKYITEKQKKDAEENAQ